MTELLKQQKLKFSFFIKAEILFGLILFVLSIVLLWSLVAHPSFTSTLPIGLTWFGLVLLVDALDRLELGETFFIRRRGFGTRRFLKIALVALVFCAVLEILGVFVGRLWYYPYWTFFAYVTLAPWAYVEYTYLLFSLYELAKKFFYKPHRSGRWSEKTKKRYRLIMNLLPWLGATGLIYTAVAVLFFIKLAPSGTLLFISTYYNRTVPLQFPLLSGVSVYFIFEYLCFRENKTTLISDLLRGYWAPLIAIFLANLVGIVLVELLSLPFGIWHYVSWPFQNITLFSLPVGALLLWPMQFFVFLAMLRFVLSKTEAEIW